MKFVAKLLIILVLFSVSYSLKVGCHPQCSWKCDDPHCPAICDPVCEPPKCHTSCAEPKNAICDIKCEKPECEIKCPDKGCEGIDCPKCVTVCKQPHCVTHCQAPKPECEPVCEEPKCDWKCHKPQCPKPKCELVCENPNCTPQVECCPCGPGAIPVPNPLPFFKETETNKECCQCNNPGQQGQQGGMRFKEIHLNNPADMDKLGGQEIYNTHDKLIKVDKNVNINTFDEPIPYGSPSKTFTGKFIPSDPNLAGNADILNINNAFQENNS
ncbi:MAG: hypothetical protein MJ252_28075 [archaeon]|nr:hypothetical protein [archaeon]